MNSTNTEFYKSTIISFAYPNLIVIGIICIGIILSLFFAIKFRPDKICWVFCLIFVVMSIYVFFSGVNPYYKDANKQDYITYSGSFCVVPNNIAGKPYNGKIGVFTIRLYLENDDNTITFKIKPVNTQPLMELYKKYTGTIVYGKRSKAIVDIVYERQGDGSKPLKKSIKM